MITLDLLLESNYFSTLPDYLYIFKYLFPDGMELNLTNLKELEKHGFPIEELLLFFCENYVHPDIYKNINENVMSYVKENWINKYEELKNSTKQLSLEDIKEFNIEMILAYDLYIDQFVEFIYDKFSEIEPYIENLYLKTQEHN